ncbi:uncharacterized protein LOC110814475 [Carica papaya]|uniref:uncharacterized protein LOC110814475 n=1 Tax=Carica papaya TaxID=3649 RepID=UPI000B8CC43E|nr:uncharacterized protein LOC110814475 [Carica papaya]
MADAVPLKRQREETDQTHVEDEVVEENKRHKSYTHILSLLDAEEDEPNQDLSSLITTLQQELSSESDFDHTFPCPPSANPTTTPASSSSSCSNEEDDRERVIRHLLEASDDELGIPNRDGTDVVGEQGFVFNGDGDGFSAPFCDGLWELEDEAANYYALLQSELFM